MPSRPNPLYAVCVKRAAQLMGGFDPLGARLGVGPARLKQWAEGLGEPPQAVFLKVVDVLLDDGIQRGLAAASQRRSKDHPPKSD